MDEVCRLRGKSWLCVPVKTPSLGYFWMQNKRLILYPSFGYILFPLDGGTVTSNLWDSTCTLVYETTKGVGSIQDPWKNSGLKSFERFILYRLTVFFYHSYLPFITVQLLSIPVDLWIQIQTIKTTWTAGETRTMELSTLRITQTMWCHLIMQVKMLEILKRKSNVY